MQQLQKPVNVKDWFTMYKFSQNCFLLRFTYWKKVQKYKLKNDNDTTNFLCLITAAGYLWKRAGTANNNQNSALPLTNNVRYFGASINQENLMKNK